MIFKFGISRDNYNQKKDIFINQVKSIIIIKI